MTKPKTHSQPLFPRPWLVTWILIYLIIFSCDLLKLCGLTSDFVDLCSTIFKLSSIILCLIYVLIYFPKDRLLQFALFTTCAADVTLAINNTLVFGVELFLVAQIIHLARQEWPRLEQPIVLASLLAALAIILDCLFPIISPMYLVCFFYVIALIGNLLAAWRWCTLEPANRRALCAFAGFTLFLCCDICTGASYLSLNLILPAALYAPANFFAWFFYYPSQVLLSNSTKLSNGPKSTPQMQNRTR